MTVAELIAKLQEMPQDARVVIDGYEQGVEDIRLVLVTRINTDVVPPEDTMYGTHEVWDRESGKPYDEVAVYLPRRAWP